MQQTFLRELASVVMRSIVVVLTIIAVLVSISWLYESERNISDGKCNVAVFPIEGTILPFHGLIDVPLTMTPEMVDSFVSAAEKEDQIEAILLEINSPGGTPVASQRIAERIHTSEKPVVGLVGDLAASGGYMVAAAADHLIASPMSSVGSIGVNASYLEESQKNEEEGVTYVQLIAGEFKDAGSPNRPITDAERERFQKELDTIQDEFIRLVARYRNIGIPEVAAIADGATLLGGEAMKANLIDGLGGRPEAKAALANAIDRDVEDVVLCDYSSGLLPF